MNVTRVLCDTKFIQLKGTPAKSGNEWVYAHRPNADDIVIILPYTEEEILFIIEERPPIIAEGRGTYSIGLVAGLVGDVRKNETIEDAIRCELLEEAGLVAESIEIKSRKVARSPGCTSEVCTIAFAKIKDKMPVQEPVTDGGIIVDRVWVKRNNIFNWLKEKEAEGCVLTAHALATMFYLFEVK